MRYPHKSFLAQLFVCVILAVLLTVTLLTYRRTLQLLKRQTHGVYGATSSQGRPADPSLRAMLSIAHNKFSIPLKGIIHIGAHHAEELDLYREKGFKNILWIEANPKHETVLRENTKHHRGSQVAIFAASAEEGSALLHVPVQHTRCASLLRPKNLTRAVKTTAQQERFLVKKTPLDSFFAQMQNKTAYNAMLVDIQGFELEALKGSVKTLQNIDFLITEVSWNNTYYDGGCAIGELDRFLGTHGFVRLETHIDNRFVDGDALYIKKHIVENHLHTDQY